MSVARMLRCLVPRRPLAPPDVRSKRVVAVIECVLNQNVRDAGAACSPALNREVLDLCDACGLGILQIPCPEQAALGLARSRPAGQSLRAAMETPAARARCAALAGALTARLLEHRQAGHQVVAVLGGNPLSPGCAVPTEGQDVAPGVFMAALHAAFARDGLEVPILPLRDSDPAALRADLERFATLARAAVGA